MALDKLDFAMTPYLDEIFQREASQQLHPAMRSDTQMDNFMVVYHPKLNLPDPSDNEGILAWLGVNEVMCQMVLKEYEDRITRGDHFVLLYKGETPETTLVLNLCDLFIGTISDDAWHRDEAHDFGAYNIPPKYLYAISC